MTITTATADAIVLETLRESGRGMTASELHYETGLDLDATQRALGRLSDQLLVRAAFGEYQARDAAAQR